MVIARRGTNFFVYVEIIRVDWVAPNTDERERVTTL
jgi:hypothetical protein